MAYIPNPQLDAFFGKILPAFLRPSRIGGPRSLVVGLTIGFSLSTLLTTIAILAQRAFAKRFTRDVTPTILELRTSEIVNGVEGLIGNTPLVRIKSLSDLTGVEILGKCEFMNPFGSVKDRVSLSIIKHGEAEGLLVPRLISNDDDVSCIFEGTSGSTGISIAGVARSRGYKAYIVLPDDVAREKVQLLEALGAEVERVRPVSIVNPKHYVNVARTRAQEFGQTIYVHGGKNSDFLASTKLDEDPFAIPKRGLFADQFENLSNMWAHENGTAPEIWKQTNGNLDVFISGAGTGGTIAGVSKTLKKLRASIKVILADPQGSGLFHKIHDNVMYAPEEAEGTRRRYQTDTIVEGIGLNRITQNLKAGLPFIDDAIKVTDEEAVAMSRFIAQHDGLFLGSSSAVNLVACVRAAKEMNGGRIVTILCDSGTRHYSRFWNDDYLSKEGIPVSNSITSILS